MAEDFLGRELSEGDRIIFATGSGSNGAVLREGMFIREHPSGYVTVRPTRNRHGKVTRSKYLDERSGNWVDPSKHVEKESHYVHKATGKELTNDQRAQYKANVGTGWNRELNPEFIPYSDRDLIPTLYKNYIREIELPGGWAIVLPGSGNIMKL